MAKKYNLSNASDMRKFTRDIANSVQDKTVDILNNRTYQIICPHCKQTINAVPGKGKCPLCHKDINLKLDIHF